MIVGEESPDDGAVSVPKKLTVGYFRQDVEEMSGRSVLDEAIAGSGRIGSLHHEFEDLQHAMGDPARAADLDAVLARFGEVQEDTTTSGAMPWKRRRARSFTAWGSTTSASTPTWERSPAAGRCAWRWPGSS